jgi:uncharacterized protein YneF (UPF0154 family)
MISFLLGLTWGLIGGIYIYAWIVKKAIKTKDLDKPIVTLTEKITAQRGEIIRVNKVEQIVKDKGEKVSLQDVIQEDNE